jgi:hypothetical protein
MYASWAESCAGCSRTCVIGDTTYTYNASCCTTTTTTVPVTTTTVAPATTTTSAGCSDGGTPCGDGSCAEDGGAWCESGSCNPVSWGCTVCSTDADCSNVVDGEPGTPTFYGFVGSIYIDENKDGDYCDPNSWLVRLHYDTCQEEETFTEGTVTVTATSLQSGQTSSGTSNSYGKYKVLTEGNHWQYDVTVSSLPSGRYIVTSQNPVRAYSDADYDDFTEINFGIYEIPASMNITGYIFNDTDEDGTKDSAESCYEGTASISCCNSTNDFTVTACQPQTWCNCSDPNTIVTLHAPSGSTVKWSGTDSSGNPIGGANTDASAVLSR